MRSRGGTKTGGIDRHDEDTDMKEVAHRGRIAGYHHTGGSATLRGRASCKRTRER